MKIYRTAVLWIAAAATCSADTSYCCTELEKSGLGDKVQYPRDTLYKQSVQSYWSIGAQLTPNCMVQPLTPQDVSLAVTTLVKANEVTPCKFAVRGGGHTTNPGASNIEDGVTIDLSFMNTTTYNENNSTASIGPGARWVNVYKVLDPIGIAVPGGRAGSVGVAGLTLGGGNSFFAARYGFVCDNVANYEIVLANGTIANANNKTNSDLFQALKGGSNNFGIVMRFDLIAFMQGHLWGGVVTYPNTTTDMQLPAFINFNNHIVDDPYGSVITFWQYSSWVGKTVVVNAYEYTKPVVNAPPFKEYLQIPGNLTSDMRLTNLSDLTGELEQAYNYRDSFHTLTFVNDQRVLQKAIDIHNNLVAKLNTSAHGNWTIVTMFQPIPTLFSKHSDMKGGNVLGLDRAKENLVLFQTDLSWQQSRDDQLFSDVGHTMISQLGDYAKSIGKDNEYLYLDYAYYTQNPIRSYGAANVQKLRSVATKYDPDQVFQIQVPGGFKLYDAGYA